MSKKTMSLARGIGAGLAAGAALGLAGAYVMENKKAMGKKGKKAIKSVENIIESVQDMFG